MKVRRAIDFEYVLSGEVWLELDDGKEAHTEPCRLLFLLSGAHRR